MRPGCTRAPAVICTRRTGRRSCGGSRASAPPRRGGAHAGARVAGHPHLPSSAQPPRPGLWRYGSDRERLLLGGATSEGGNVYAWCREVLRLPDDATLEQRLEAMTPDAHGLTVLPFLAGERAPGWRGDRRGAVARLSLDTGPLEIVRAALEAVALRLALVYRLLAPHAPREHRIVASRGALTPSRVWTQILADALGHPGTWSHEPETTSRGVAVVAWEGA